MPLNELRQLFLNYFKNHNHHLTESSNLIPTNDDTLLFTNSGMVQFKHIFTSLQQPTHPTAVSVQKCIRAGGKHNDLDNVGYTARHHTFFEMLGNFSFGDYFKEQAIYYAWDFIHNTLKLPKEKIFVTVYHTDEEAALLWKKISGLGDDKIIKISSNDNFWSMGEVGPCGPCSEIFYDYGDHVKGGLPGSTNAEGDRFVEIWNLVFMQFEKLATGELISLNKKSIDTGLGLERLASVMQGKHDNYDTDIFVTIINSIQDTLKIKLTVDNKIAFKVISDHLRAIAFLISENVMPSNEGRGYVLRRIIRRSIRYAYLLGAKEPVLYKIVPSVITVMGGFYMQLLQKKDSIITVLKQEEEKFFDTFANGIQLLNKEISNNKSNTFAGDVAFKLYDTYGFPVDLTENILKQHNILLNRAEFDKALENHKNLAKSSWTGSGENKDNPIWFNLDNKFGATKFTGYDNSEDQSTILCLLNENLESVEVLPEGSSGFIILDKTPFYATMGGQAGDEGHITNNSFNATVITTSKNQNIFAHKVSLSKGSVKINDTVFAKINTVNRNILKKHHTAAHLLQSALIKKLGNHITQQGSSVTAQRFRFDVSHTKPITKEELADVENAVNNIIKMALPVEIQNMPTADAVKQGALAMFGEKYPTIARTVKIQNNSFLSFELCGGTHVNNTAEIGVFKIISESSLAAGVRRIEAVCSTALLDSYNQNLETLNQINKTINSNHANVVSKIKAITEDTKMLQNSISQVTNKYYMLLLENKFAAINNKNILFETLDINIDELKDVVNLMLTNKTQSVVALFNATSCAIVVGITKDLLNSVNLKELSVKINELLVGNGGGSNTLIQSKGTTSNNIDKVIELIKSL